MKIRRFETRGQIWSFRSQPEVSEGSRRNGERPARLDHWAF